MKKPIYTEPEEKESEQGNEASDGIDTNSNIDNPTVGGDTAPAEVIDPLLTEPKIERDHTSGPIPGGSNRPQPEFTPSFSNEEEKPPSNQPSEEGEQPQYPDYEDIAADENLPPEQAKENADMTADMVLEMYGGVKRRIGNWLLPISEKKLARMQEEGDIDLSMMVNYGGKPTPAINIISAYNTAAHDRFGLREEYVKRAKPIIADELLKRGWVMSRLQYLGYITFLDVSKDVEIGIQLKAQGNEILEALKETTAAWREHGGYTEQTATTTGQQQQQTEVHHPPPANTPAARVEDTFAEIQSHKNTTYAGNMQPGQATADISKVKPIVKNYRTKSGKKKSSKKAAIK